MAGTGKRSRDDAGKLAPLTRLWQTLRVKQSPLDTGPVRFAAAQFLWPKAKRRHDRNGVAPQDRDLVNPLLCVVVQCLSPAIILSKTSRMPVSAALESGKKPAFFVDFFAQPVPGA